MDRAARSRAVRRVLVRVVVLAREHRADAGRRALLGAGRSRSGHHLGGHARRHRRSRAAADRRRSRRLASARSRRDRDQHRARVDEVRSHRSLGRRRHGAVGHVRRRVVVRRRERVGRRTGYAAERRRPPPRRRLALARPHGRHDDGSLADRDRGHDREPHRGARARHHRRQLQRREPVRTAVLRGELALRRGLRAATRRAA